MTILRSVCAVKFTSLNGDQQWCSEPFRHNYSELDFLNEFNQYIEYSENSTFKNGYVSQTKSAICAQKYNGGHIEGWVYCLFHMGNEAKESRCTLVWKICSIDYFSWVCQVSVLFLQGTAWPNSTKSTKNAYITSKFNRGM